MHIQSENLNSTTAFILLSLVAAQDLIFRNVSNKKKKKGLFAATVCVLDKSLPSFFFFQ